MRTQVGISLIDATLRTPVAATLIEDVADEELWEADSIGVPLLVPLNLEQSHRGRDTRADRGQTIGDRIKQIAQWDRAVGFLVLQHPLRFHHRESDAVRNARESRTLAISEQDESFLSLDFVETRQMAQEKTSLIHIAHVDI